MGFLVNADGFAKSRGRSRVVQDCTPLVDAVSETFKRVQAPFFCPGHKRGVGASPEAMDLIGRTAFQADLCELPELDSLSSPNGVIMQAETAAAKAFGAKRTFFLINGSTAGVISSIVAAVRLGRKKIVLPRNAHQCAVHALVVSGADGVFLLPEYSEAEDVLHGVTADAVKQALQENPGEIAAVFIVSPTYHGVTSDIAAIADIAHQHGALLIVDEAHGAHSSFHEKLPTPALELNADVVVQSTHKTLGSLTQSAMMHLGKQCSLQDADIHSALSLVQSTSPSYLLLSSLDAARAYAAKEGPAIYDTVVGLAQDARRRINAIDGLSILEKPESMSEIDPTRLTVCLGELTCSGFDVDEFLCEKHGVYAELPSFRHITFILSIGTSVEDVERLVSGFESVASQFRRPEGDQGLNVSALVPQTPAFGEPVISARDAFFKMKEQVALDEAVGRICASPVCPYPPGIPVLLPGERISAECVDYLKMVLDIGGSVTGAQGDIISCLVLEGTGKT